MCIIRFKAGKKTWFLELQQENGTDSVEWPIKLFKSEPKRAAVSLHM